MNDTVKKDSHQLKNGQACRSQLAKMQQWSLGTVFLLAIVWLIGFWPRHPLWAVAGTVWFLTAHVWVLAAGFLLVSRVNRDDPAPRAGAPALMQAWWREAKMAVRVFGWQQPFLWRKLPDTVAPAGDSLPPVVFVHGFLCNRGFWLSWMDRLRIRTQPYVSVNLEPIFGSIDAYVPQLDEAVYRAQTLNGKRPVLVCHSMGGLVARAWLANVPGAGARVSRVITIGSPHHGTWLGRFSRTPNGQQMRLNGPWIQALQMQEEKQQPCGTYPPFICWYSNADNIVFPASTATLPLADNRHVPGVAHVALAFHPEVIERSLAMLAIEPEDAH